MSVATSPQVSWPTVHRQFEAALPQIDNTIRFQFRTWPKRLRAEAIADAQAAAWHAWHGLLVRGKDPLAIGPTGIAFNACRYVKNGRRFGTGTAGRSGMDIYSRRAQRSRGFKLVEIEQETAEHEVQTSGGWREWIAADNRCTPADEAAFRLDFAVWLDALPPRKRRMAELLAEGHETGVVARLLGVTPGAVSQTRAWLNSSWSSFQGQDH